MTTPTKERVRELIDKGPIIPDGVYDTRAALRHYLALLEAVDEIDELVSDEADITNSGGPNLAMRIQTILSAARL